MKKLILGIAFAFLFLNLWSQNVLQLGKWRSHLPYKIGKYVTQSPNTVFYATDFSVLAIDKNDVSARYPISKTESLSQSGIQQIKYVPGSKILMVVYTNGVIDLVGEEEVITNFHIKNFQNIAVGKRVNEVFVAGDSLVLLAGSFGISELNLDASEFEFTTFTGVNVNTVAQFNGYYYACTNEGIYRSSVNNFFVEDFTTWKLLDQSEGFPADYSTKMIAVYNDRLYFDINGKLFRLDSDQTPLFVHDETSEYNLKFLTSEGAHLLVGYQNTSPAERGKLLYFNENEEMGNVPTICLGIPTYAIESSSGRIWMADLWRQLRMLPGITSDKCDFFDINSPFSERAYTMDIVDDQLWVGGGGISSVYGPLSFSDGVYSYIDGSWTTYNRTNNRIMMGESTSNNEDDLLDIIAVVYDKKTDNLYAGSFLEGLAVIGENSA
ncbi:MAG TPA: hypothetical protein ENK75_07370 [Saprospiraceae bacterium]|nr:hypothetical protein [Saprospiraceae bacterium]